MIGIGIIMALLFWGVPTPGNYILMGAVVIGCAIEESSKRGRE